MIKQLICILPLMYATSGFASDIDALIKKPANNPMAEFEQAKAWAMSQGIDKLNFASLGTLDANNQLHQHMMTVAKVDKTGFSLKMYSKSPKAMHIADNKQVALLYHWAKGDEHMQIKVRGMMAPGQDASTTESKSATQGTFTTYQLNPQAVHFIYTNRSASPVTNVGVLYKADSKGGWQLTNDSSAYPKVSSK